MDYKTYYKKIEKFKNNIKKYALERNCVGDVCTITVEYWRFCHHK